MHIDEILRDQDGVITRRQAEDAGLTRAQIEHRLATRAWVRAGCSVYRSAAHPESDRSRLRAHALRLGPDATLIGVGAAWWLRMTDEAPSRFRFAVPGWRRVRGSDELGVLRRDLHEDECMLVDGIRTTTRAVTALDAVAELGHLAGADLMDRALLRGRVTVETLLAAHRAALGRWGSRTAGEVLALAAGGARFEAERRLHRALRAAGIEGWHADVTIMLPGYGEALLDLAFRAERIVVEVDGWAYHREPDDFRRDRHRQNSLVLAGWTVIRVTWRDLVDDPDRVVGWIRDALSH